LEKQKKKQKKKHPLGGGRALAVPGGLYQAREPETRRMRGGRDRGH